VLCFSHVLLRVVIPPTRHFLASLAEPLVFEPKSIWDSSLLTTSDLREFPRLRVWGDATLRAPDDSRAAGVRVTLIDISHGGVCFEVDRELLAGDRIALDMEPPAPNPPLTLEAEVRWIVADIDPGAYRVGCEWTQPLSIDNLLQFC